MQQMADHIAKAVNRLRNIMAKKVVTGKNKTSVYILWLKL